jgi:hypothetical protein
VKGRPASPRREVEAEPLLVLEDPPEALLERRDEVLAADLRVLVFEQLLGERIR